MINDPLDPFVEYSRLEQTLGEDFATKIMVRHEDHIMNTCNWGDINAQDEFDSVEDFITRYPDRKGELYLNAYPVLDDADVITRARKLGYDGAVYAGSGANLGEPEYRVFSARSIVYALSGTLAQTNKHKQADEPAP